MNENQWGLLFKIHGDLLYVRYLEEILFNGFKNVPIKKNVFGLYTCSQNIIEREKNLYENLEMINVHLVELCDEMRQFIKMESERRSEP